jgi:hypothetical protein
MISKLEEKADDEDTQKKIKKLKLYKVFMKCKAEEERSREKYEEISEANNEDGTQNEVEDNNSNIRRDHCYLYIFKKK